MAHFTIYVLAQTGLTLVARKATFGYSGTHYESVVVNKVSESIINKTWHIKCTTCALLCDYEF